MDAAKDNHFRIGFRRPFGKLQGVSAQIRCILDLGGLVVVGKKDAMPFVKPTPYAIQCIVSVFFSIHNLLDIVNFDMESQAG